MLVMIMMSFSDDEDDEGDSDVASLSAFDRCRCQKQMYEVHADLYIDDKTYNKDDKEGGVAKMMMKTMTTIMMRMMMKKTMKTMNTMMMREEGQSDLPLPLYFTVQPVGCSIHPFNFGTKTNYVI